MDRSLFDRDDYPTLEEGVYLNQAALGLLGDPVVGAMHDHLHGVARHGNLRMSDADEEAFLDGLRERAARLFSVVEARVAVTSGASELLAQAPFLLSPEPGSKVLAVATDFPAITRPWLRLAREGGCEVEFAEDRPGSDLTADLVGRIDAGTSVVAVGWVQYATGTVVDVSRLREASRAAGARLVIDATQGAGALECDAGGWDADMVVSSGYKWLGGHGGVAVGALAPEVIARTPPLTGWMGAATPFDFDATRMSLAEGGRRFTQSTMSYVSVVGLATAVERLLDAGAAAVESHAAKLRKALLDAVGKLGWRPFRPPGDPASAPHIVSLGHPEERAAEAQERLREAGVVCSGRGDRLRVSLAPYNDGGDVEALAAALA